jgi:uncharacterized protein YdeI (YjbR/CyaY-like superfamily)
MATKDKRIDEYISKSAPFAKPILNKFRALVHKACPDAEETMKWSFPHFDYKGQMMCSMASFRQHCAISFWKASLMKDAATLKDSNREAMGHYGRITSLDDLPPDKTIIANIKEAMKLNDEGITIAPRKKTTVTGLNIPAELEAALKKNKKAKSAFEAFSPSNKKEYADWISEAKTDDTRNKRLVTAVEWIAEGKTLNWKYKKS